MKLSISVAVGAFLGSTLCSEVVLGESKRALALRESLQFYDLSKDPSFGRDLDEVSLNEFMKRVSGEANSHYKVHLLKENKIIMNKSYEELANYAFGYGLTEILGSLLFQYDGWEFEFNRHVYAAHFYKRKGVPLEEWHYQSNLDWGANYQAIFKADNPELLRDLLLNPSKLTLDWDQTSSGIVNFIKQHLYRLIIRYDSARILQALHTPEFADLAAHLSFNLVPAETSKVITDELKEHKGNIYIEGDNCKLRATFKKPFKFNSILSYDDIEYIVEYGLFESSKEDIFSSISNHDYDWALDTLHRNDLLEGSIEERYFAKIIKGGNYKALAWIYDHLSGLLPVSHERLDGLMRDCHVEGRLQVLKVHKSFFNDFLPSKHLINNDGVGDAEFLDFLATFETPLFPKQKCVQRWRDCNLRLRVYKANPNWIVSDDEIVSGVRVGHSEFVEYALERRAPGIIIKKACGLRLFQYNAEIDNGYVPVEVELVNTFNMGDIEAIDWLYKQERFKELFESDFSCIGLNVYRFEAIKWLWENKGWAPSEEDVAGFATSENLEACEWALKSFRDVIMQLKGAQIDLSEKKMIEWWIDNKVEIIMFLAVMQPSVGMMSIIFVGLLKDGL